MTTRAKKGFRFPIFWKILASCLTLSALLITGSFFYTQWRMQETAQGAVMARGFKRFQAYRAGMGQAVGSVAEVLAGNDALRAAVATGGGDGGAALAKGLLQTISGKNGVRPDLFVVFDVHGKTLFVADGSPVGGDELRQLEAVTRVRTGGAFYQELLLHKNRAFQVAGVPILRPGTDEPVGGVLMGVALERYFEEFRVQSDEREERRQRLTLVRDGEVLASVFPRETWAELAESIRPEKRKQALDGGNRIDVLGFDGETWDFHGAAVAGFVGQGHGPIGDIYIQRPRVERPSNMAYAVLSGSGFALLVAFVLAKLITRPVHRFNQATREIADGEGDLNHRIVIDCNDEMSDLADNINALFDNLQRLARDVQGASFQVGASSAEISAASRQMLDGVKDQALKVESSTAAVTELSSSIQQVASNALEATKVAQQSNESVSEAMDSMNQIRSSVENASEKIHDLGESVKRIGNIVEVIRQISEQTSLLALNASIEAAHAGEQGRGFAVVADEVSSLARRVGQSAKDIEDLIATIKDQTADAVRTMQAGTESVESGTSQVTHTLANLKQIVAVVEDTARAVQEQAIVSDEIARNMDAVQKIAGEVLASSEEAVIQGEQLHSLAYQLEDSVRGFRLEEDKAAVRRELPREAGRSGDGDGRSGGAALPPAREAGHGTSRGVAKAAQGGRRPSGPGLKG